MRIIKQIVKRVIPERLFVFMLKGYLGIHESWQLISSYYSDYRRYRTFSSKHSGSNKTHNNLSAMIFMQAHALEKGFSLPDIRSGFGSERIKLLAQLLEKYKTSGFPMEDLSVQKASSVLSQYIRYHDLISFELGAMRTLIQKWENPSCDIAGYAELTREEILKTAVGDFEDCALSRWSIRNYTDEQLPDEVLLDAVRIARKTPSACNRQAWKAYFIRDEKLKADILSLQNGNRGFGSKAPCVIVITADMCNFVGAGERNESFVDGGMFAMSLLYALHYKGIGACPLNWMVTPDFDKKLRKLLKVAPSENVIMMIVAGKIPAKVRVAKSVRRAPENFAIFD